MDNEKYEVPYQLSQMQESTHNFETNQLETDFKEEIIFDLVQSGSGGLFIFEVYLNGHKIGSGWSKSYKMISAGPMLGFKNSGEKIAGFFYSTRKVFDKEQEARKESNTTGEYIYCFDEYWWSDKECGDAWFPTFDTLQQLLEYNRLVNEEIRPSVQ